MVDALCVLKPVYDLLGFILHTDKELPRFLGDVPSPELICADPSNYFLSTFKRHLTDSERDGVPLADLVSVMTVNYEALPRRNGVSTTVAHNICFQLQILCTMKGTNEVSKLPVDFQCLTTLFFHTQHLAYESIRRSVRR